jgi:hypothetical protein
MTRYQHLVLQLAPSGRTFLGKDSTTTTDFEQTETSS